MNLDFAHLLTLQSEANSPVDLKRIKPLSKVLQVIVLFERHF